MRPHKVGIREFWEKLTTYLLRATSLRHYSTRRTSDISSLPGSLVLADQSSQAAARSRPVPFLRARHDEDKYPRVCAAGARKIRALAANILVQPF